MVDTSVRQKVVVVCGPSRTKQSFREKVNVNSIVARYNKTGMVDHVSSKTPFYGDVSNIASYQEALAVVASANDLFNAMDSRVRERFANDPLRMIQFLQDPSNLDEAIKLGMVAKRPEEPVEAPVAPVVPSS